MKAATWGFSCMIWAVGVDEERAGQGVGAVVDIGLGGFDIVDSQGLEGVGVFVEVSVAEVTDGELVASHTLNENVVIFGELHAFETEQGFFASFDVGFAFGVFEVREPRLRRSSRRCRSQRRGSRL